MIVILERYMEGRKFIVADHLTVADFNAAYTLNWADEQNLLGNAPRLREYLKAMYSRPTALQTIAEAFAALRT